MVKPQFEVGKEAVGKKGVVRDPQKRIEAINRVIQIAQSLGLCLIDQADASIKGPQGNQEHFLCFKTPSHQTNADIL
jgi:23S rRNA (cytidine1920-2'-O)/16S rRNA (cytidine1409-2'-O)-methyltransferase